MVDHPLALFLGKSGWWRVSGGVRGDGCGCEVEEDGERVPPHDSRGGRAQTRGGVNDCESEGSGLGMDMDRHGEGTAPLSRYGVKSEGGNFDDPTLDPEAEGTVACGGCNADTYPCVTEERLGSGWRRGLPRDGRWCQGLDRGSSR